MHIIHNLRRAGAQQVVRTLVEHLASDECVPVVCTFRDGPLRQDIEQLGIKVEVLPSRRYSIVDLPLFLVDMIRIWRSLTRLIKKHEIDVVQTHLLRILDFLVLFLRYTTGLRVVLWTFHSAKFVLAETELTEYKWLLKPRRCVHRLLYRLASRVVDGFIAVSDEVKETMVEVIGPIQDRITVICNGVDIRKYGHPADKARLCSKLGLGADARFIAVVGNLGEPKGHRYLVEAMTTVAPQYSNAHVLFIGDGPLREELQAQVGKLSLGQQVHFLGNRDDVPDLLAASELFVLPSLWEGLSMALLEAMAAGKPIVATAVSGTEQVMTHGETGLVVPPSDSRALADAIVQLLADPVQAQAMGQAAKQHVTMDFSAQKQADEHLALYYRLIESESSPRFIAS